MDKLNWIPLPLDFLGQTLPFIVEDVDNRLCRGFDFILLWSSTTLERDIAHGVFYRNDNGIRVGEYHPSRDTMTHYCIVHSPPLCPYNYSDEKVNHLLQSAAWV